MRSVIWVVLILSALYAIAGGSALPLVVVAAIWLLGNRLGLFGSGSGRTGGATRLPGGSAAFVVSQRPDRHLGPRGGPRAAGREGHLERRSSPTRYDVPELARRLGLGVEELRAARAAYGRFTIPKRSGGTREIRAPDEPTKRLQRRILHRLLDRVPVHPDCHGFQAGRGIVSNATPHSGRPVVMRLDVEDFFRSTDVRRVRRLYRVLGWDRESARILTRLTTLDGGLPQGAPTSPRLANLVNVRLDARLAGLARARGAVYTRYADDLTFSFAHDDPAAIRDVIRATKRFMRQHGYRLHEGRKLRIRRRHERQLVTGLVVNVRPALPRTRRRWLRAVEHHLRVGRPATLTEPQLAGWRAYELMIEAPKPPPPGAAA